MEDESFSKNSHRMAGLGTAVMAHDYAGAPRPFGTHRKIIGGEAFSLVTEILTYNCFYVHCLPRGLPEKP